MTYHCLKARTLIVAMALIFSAADSFAGDTAPAGNATIGDASKILPPAELAVRLGLDPSALAEGPIEGLYELVSGTTVRYVTKDGRFLIGGGIVDLTTRKNVTDQRKNKARAALLRNVDDSNAIVFSPPDGVVKHRLTVFTDVDCGYCRQFHREIAEVNKLGVEVRYLSWPRTGPDSESWFKAVKVWCAKDRRAAITNAKLGQPPPDVPGCDSEPTIRQDYELGERVGVEGTPAVFTDNGVHIGGYIPSGELLDVIETAEKE